MRSVPSGTPVWRATSRIVRTSGTCSGGGLEGGARLEEAQPDAALGGAERHALDAGDLLAREAAAVGQQKRLALVFRELVEGAQPGERALAGDHDPARRLGGRDEGTLLLRGPVDGGRAGAARAPAVERAAAGHH